MSQLLRLVGVALVLVVVIAGPAAADPAGPSDFRSAVTGLSPDIDGVTAEIRGGDSFLQLTVDPGRVVVVEGYSGEPYLRINPDGSVERNRLSEATYLNDDRRGAGITIPADVQAAEVDTPPDWERVADDGVYAWHDHRVHWMAEVSPPVARGERVEGAYDPWRVPITVDGAPTEVQGTLLYADTVSPLPYAAVAILGGGLLIWFGRGRGLRLPATFLVVVAAAASAVGSADYRATPDGGGNPLLWALAAAALVAAIGASALARRSAGVVLALASVATLSGWTLFRIQALTTPILPTDLPFALDRTTIALALGASAATAYLAVTSPVLDPDMTASGSSFQGAPPAR